MVKEMPRRNPNEDVELPIWHPAHFVQQHHLAFNAQLVMRRCTVEDVEDFLVGIAEITPQWADRMLRPLVESGSRRKVVQRALANKTKKNLSAYEWGLLNWNVDADTDIAWAVERAMEARERAPFDTSITDGVGNLLPPQVEHQAPVSSYFRWVWGITDEDVDSARRSRYLLLDVPNHYVRDILQICFREPLHSFFAHSAFSDAPNRGTVSSTNIHAWGKLASLWGYPRPMDEHSPSAPFVHRFARGLVDSSVRLIVENMYRLAQEELARATAVVSLYYALEYLPGGPVSQEQRRAAVERRQRRHELKAKRQHTGWLAGGLRDTPVDVAAAYYADVFGVT